MQTPIIPDATARVKRLFDKSLQCPMQKENLSYQKDRRQGLLYMRGWLAHADIASVRLRRAYAEAYVLRHMRPVIDADELIVGAPDLSPLTPEEETEKQALAAQMCAAPRSGGRRGHMTLDWAKLLRVGVRGLLEEIKALRGALDLMDPGALAKDEFYEGCLVELEALLALAASYRDAARAMGLEDVADLLARVPEHPARTFREALQSIHFYGFCLWDLYFYGRADQYLLTYYEADLAAGRLTETDALELFDCLMILSAHAVTPKSVQVVTIGGRDRAGRPVENALTRLALHSVAHARVQVAQTALLVGESTGEDVLRLAVELLARGYSQPQLYNDDAISASLRAHGFPEDISHAYANCGCVEIVPCACSGMWPVSPYHNTLAMLLRAMREEPDTLQALLSRFEVIVREEVRAGQIAENRLQMERARNGNECLRVSCLVDDCLPRGMSVDEGGARYNHIQPNFLGMANVIDALAAVDTLVYRGREYTMASLLAVLDADYAGDAALRSRIVNKLPHFGQSEPWTDAMARRVSEIYLRACEGLRSYRDDSPVLPGAFSYHEHVRHGAQTGATPDGRMAGYPLAAGSSPVQGSEVRGPTASLRSAAAWDQARFLGGVANNLMLSKSMLDAEGKQKLVALIRTFFAMGGLELQLNVTDLETLQKARECPEQYRDLLVRVGGFNAYFVDCEPMLQQEIMDRNAHAMA